MDRDKRRETRRRTYILDVDQTKNPATLTATTPINRDPPKHSGKRSGIM